MHCVRFQPKPSDAFAPTGESDTIRNSVASVMALNNIGYNSGTEAIWTQSVMLNVQLDTPRISLS
jgi:hypothetical protein